MKKLRLSALTLGLLSLTGLSAADYGLSSEIQKSNILHCFDWTISDVKASLPNIAAAGFGSVQLSPLQRSDVRTGSPWHDLWGQPDFGYDPSYFDDPFREYSYGDNTSAEKEDEDIITYAPARVGRLATSAIENIESAVEAADMPAEYYTLQGIRVIEMSQPGLYIVKKGNKTSKVLVK